MRTTLHIDDTLIDKAASLTGVTEKTALVRKGLEALIARESARRLAALGGSEKELRLVRRRRGLPSACARPALRRDSKRPRHAGKGPVQRPKLSVAQ